jgi:hypothetical protein
MKCYPFGDPIPFNTICIQPEDMGRLHIDIRERWATSAVGDMSDKRAS